MSQNVAVQNLGATALAIGGIGISGANAGDFGESNTCGSSLAAGSSCVISVVFSPTAPGARSATVSIVDTAGNSPQLVSLSGTAVALTAPQVTWAPPGGITYGTLLNGVQLNATASVPGQFVYIPSAGTLLGAGTDTLSVTFTPTDTTHYSTTSATVQIVVGKAIPTVTWATPAAITYGIALSAVQLDASASTAGTFAYSPAVGTFLMAGTQKLSAGFAPTDVADYTSVAGSTSLTVNPANLTVTASNASRLYGAANPVFTASLSGTVDNDVLSATASSVATSSSVTGSYPIVPTATGTNIANYAVTPVNGTLTIISQTGSSTTVAASVTSSMVGTSVTFTATVASATTGTPTGSVQFLSGASVLGSVQLTGGTASYTA